MCFKNPSHAFPFLPLPLFGLSTLLLGPLRLTPPGLIQLQRRFEAVGRDTDLPTEGDFQSPGPRNPRLPSQASVSSCGGQIRVTLPSARPNIHIPPRCPSRSSTPEALNSRAVRDTQMTAAARCNDPSHRSPVPLTNNDHDQSYARLHCENLSPDTRSGMNPHQPSRCWGFSVRKKKINDKKGHSDSTGRGCGGVIISCTKMFPIIKPNFDPIAREFPPMSSPSPR